MSERTVISVNRKARFEYAIEDVVEAGIILQGTEVKSLRRNDANLQDAYAGQKDGELYLFNLYIGVYAEGNRFNHEPRRPRKLLLHGKEMKKLLGRIKTKGITLIPLQLYFTPRGIAKVEIGLARGKKQYEKRQDIKEKDWKREQARLMKN